MIARQTSCLLACALLLSAVAFAEPPAATSYTLKNRSTFSAMTDEQRAPFWPIGWTKRRPMAAQTVAMTIAEPKVHFDASNVKVTSILLGSPSLAIINGRSYSEGDFLRQPRLATAQGVAPAPAVVGAAMPRVRVYRINDGSVVLQCSGELTTVNLQRPELVQRSAAEDLLTEDRP